MSSMTLRIPAKVLIHVRSYDFYDMTLSTGKQRRRMIKTGHVYMNFFLRARGPRTWSSKYQGDTDDQVFCDDIEMLTDKVR